MIKHIYQSRSAIAELIKREILEAYDLLNITHALLLIGSLVRIKNLHFRFFNYYLLQSLIGYFNIFTLQDESKLSVIRESIRV
jgi:hypothetical protein